ncbi:MAG: hypothetical protein V4671_23850 [Armatimonadota bacterium]
MTEATDQAALTRAYRAVRRAHEHISLAGLSLFQKNIHEAQEHRLEAQGAAAEALGTLRDLKAETAEPVLPVRPLDLLQLDTPDSRRLLALLEEAQAVADRVDASRGRALPADIPLQPGESRGTDLAESISYIALRVRGEVRGPQGRD